MTLKQTMLILSLLSPSFICMGMNEETVILNQHIDPSKLINFRFCNNLFEPSSGPEYTEIDDTFKKTFGYTLPKMKENSDTFSRENCQKNINTIAKKIALKKSKENNPPHIIVVCPIDITDGDDTSFFFDE
jgi:hypothetical protein